MRSLFLGLLMATAMTGLATQVSFAETSDETMAQLIANDLKESGRLKDYRVGVKCKDGVAWLMGTVTSQQQKQAAELIARNTEGVAHVVSKLEIESSQEELPLQDLQIKDLQITKASASSRDFQTSSRSTGRRPSQNNMPVPYARTGQGVQAVSYGQPAQYAQGRNQMPGGTMGPAAMGRAVSYDNPQMLNYAWPSYAAAPNYAALTYSKQYSASAWPYIGPFYPYPQVPLGWRKVTLEWDDGWWFLDFKDK